MNLKEETFHTGESHILLIYPELKSKKKAELHEYYRGKNIPLILKNKSRTRCSFEVATHDLGMGSTYLDPTGSQIGKKEALQIQQEFWEECTMVSNIVDLLRKS